MWQLQTKLCHVQLVQGFAHWHNIVPKSPTDYKFTILIKKYKINIQYGAVLQRVQLSAVSKLNKLKNNSL